MGNEIGNSLFTNYIQLHKTETEKAQIKVHLQLYSDSN